LKYSKLDVHFSQLDFLLQNKFTSLSLAFKTDKLTLEKRLEIQERYRDLSEQNVEKEIKGLRSSVEVSDPHTTIQFFKKKKKKKSGEPLLMTFFQIEEKIHFKSVFLKLDNLEKFHTKLVKKGQIIIIDI
jgi:hypothetical protein